MTYTINKKILKKITAPFVNINDFNMEKYEKIIDENPMFFMHIFNNIKELNNHLKYLYPNIPIIFNLMENYNTSTKLNFIEITYILCPQHKILPYLNNNMSKININTKNAKPTKTTKKITKIIINNPITISELPQHIMYTLFLLIPTVILLLNLKMLP